VTGTNTTQIATTAFVAAAIGALIDAAPGAMDTLNELAAALGDDPNFATTVTNALAGKLSAASNLSDLPNKATARTNLGLGSIATQAANSVAITGGSIDGIALDGGTF
jgi:phage-related tail fiber protein